MTQQVFGEALTAVVIASGDQIVAAVVDVETGMFPAKQIAQLALADEFLFAQQGQEAMAEDFTEWADVTLGQPMKGPVRGKHTIGYEHMKMGMKDEVVSEGVDGGDGAKFALGQIELRPKDVSEGLDGTMEEQAHQPPALAKDAPQHFGNGENHLSVRDLMADVGSDPLAGGAHASLMARGAEVAGLAGEGEQALVAAVGAFEAGESGGKIAASHKGLHGPLGTRIQRPE